MKDVLKQFELDERSVSYDGSYIASIDATIDEMQKQIDKGHEIVWSTNERWCTINNKTFTVAKALFNNWVENGRIILSSN